MVTAGTHVEFAALYEEYLDLVYSPGRERAGRRDLFRAVERELRAREATAPPPPTSDYASGIEPPAHGVEAWSGQVRAPVDPVRTSEVWLKRETWRFSEELQLEELRRQLESADCDGADGAEIALLAALRVALLCQDLRFLFAYAVAQWAARRQSMDHGRQGVVARPVLREHHRRRIRYCLDEEDHIRTGQLPVRIVA